jgi:MarR family transcriptional regulator, organic hydroperoxide resistance regulator
MVDNSFCSCFYFTTSKMARSINKMAQEEFSTTGLSPTYAFVLMTVNEKPGIAQNEICEIIHVTPSTLTRFIDKLEGKGLVKRHNEGKNSFIYSTEEGIKLQKDIEKSWTNLYARYSKILGYEEGDKLTKLIDEAGNKLEGR